MPVFLKFTNTDPFAAWFVVNGNGFLFEPQRLLVDHIHSRWAEALG